MSFILPPPLGFRGLHPDIPVTAYQRHLPHWRQEGATYFVTFRLCDALPQSVQHFLVQLKIDWERRHPPPWTEAVWADYARTVHSAVEQCLDDGYGACWLRNANSAAGLEQLMCEPSPNECHVGCWTMMPNHVHVVMRPAPDYELERILQRWKSRSAVDINFREQRSGAVWQQESYDRIVRDEEHLWRVVQYIGRNPGRAKLPQDQWRRWIDPDWEAAGWRFVDDVTAIDT